MSVCLRFVSSLPLTDFQFTASLSHDVPLTTNLGHCLYVLGSTQRTGEKLLLQYDTRQGMSTSITTENGIQLNRVSRLLDWKMSSECVLESVADSWCELLSTLTRADADLPVLYFLMGASDKLVVNGGNNLHDVVTSFYVRSQKWGQVKTNHINAHAHTFFILSENQLPVTFPQLRRNGLKLCPHVLYCSLRRGEGVLTRRSSTMPIELSWSTNSYNPFYIVFIVFIFRKWNTAVVFFLLKAHYNNFWGLFLRA